MLDRRQIEAGEMIQLQPFGIGQHRLEVRRGIVTANLEPHEVFIAIAIGDLQEAEPVAWGDEAHGLGVDSNRTRRKYAFGKIFFV